MSVSRAVAAGIFAGALAACAAVRNHDQVAPIESASSAAPQQQAAVVYAKRVEGAYTGGVVLRQPADLVKLYGAPPDFRAFIAGELRAAASHHTSTLGAAQCLDGSPEISVYGITATVATGSEFRCNRRLDAAWTKAGDTWKLAAEFGGRVSCADLRDKKIPKELAPTGCFVKGRHWELQPYEGPTLQYVPAEAGVVHE